MNFARAHRVVADFLEEVGAPCAVVGGVAVAAYGNPRSTLDLDLVTTTEIQDRLVAFLESRGYATLHRSSGFSNHRHPDAAWGRVDVMYVVGNTAALIFAGTSVLPGPGGQPIVVPRPEHLIAMKVHAMKHSPERTWQEMVDIAHLLAREGIDRDEVRAYFEKAGLAHRWEELASGS